MSDFSGGTKLIPAGQDIFNVAYGDDKGLYVEFYYREIEDQKRSLLEGRPIFESREYIKIMPIGNKNKIIDRPIQKTDTARFPSDIRRFPRQWEAFKNQEAQVLDGTPITEWPQITRSDAMSLKAMNIHTIEMLADLQDNNLTWLGARKIRDMAKLWIEKAKGGAESAKWAKEKTDMMAQIEALRNQMAGFTAAGVMPEQKKRGRPAKQKDDAG